MGEPPRVRSSLTMPPETWCRLPDSGFEVLHSFPGNQAVGAQPLRVQIRRLGPATADGQWEAEPGSVVAHHCDHCEAMDRVFALARVFEDEGITGTADLLYRVAERVGRRDDAGRVMVRALLGRGPC